MYFSYISDYLFYDRYVIWGIIITGKFLLTAIFLSDLFLVKAPSVSFFKAFFYRVVPYKVLRCYLIIVLLSSRGPTQSRGPFETLLEW